MAHDPLNADDPDGSGVRGLGYALGLLLLCGGCALIWGAVAIYNGWGR